jgi:hypothetical protein
MANALFPGRDGNGYAGDLGYVKRALFLFRGVDIISENPK